ncbi:MAG: STAS domain-containing protein [Solirubrobacterales bacterium]|nr:STAS domain-containing protein [Solirubrobacterales bacterium]
MMPTDLATIESEPHGRHVVVRVIGELDVFNAGPVAAQVEAAVPAGAHGAVIDFTALGFMDSTGIRKLFALAARLIERRQEVRVVVLEGGPVARTLELVEFSRAAPMHPSLDEALAQLGTGSPPAHEPG